jgi:RNA polymerase sigma factor (sigma-70 family)
MDKKPTLTDEALLERYYTSKDNRWLGQLLQRYTLLLYGVALKYLKEEDEARDIVQQVFIKVLEELDKYRVTHFKAWLYTIVRNQCLMKLRQSAQQTVSFPENFEGESTEENDHTTWQENEQTAEKLQEALAALNTEQRNCITLFYLEKLSYQQITERTGYSYQEVKSHLQNGKRNLKIWLLAKGGKHE